ncbi:MAG: hypothetical protein JXD22_14665 [Sedimentisphaerales bacterium]|nr:hypothetical protein [Sedimentisphaerales bacterium]
MFSRKMVIGFVIAGLFSIILIGQLQSQQDPGASTGRGRGPGRGQGGMRFDPAQMQQRMMERLKENLAVKDEEWKIIEPRLTSVVTLSREVNSSGMRGFGRGGRGPGGPGSRGGQGRNQGTATGEAAASSPPPSEIEKSTAALQTVLEDEKSTPDQIKKTLTAVRTAREKGKQKLAKAKEELRKVLTVRQEAQLVLMGYLD